MTYLCFSVETWKLVCDICIYTYIYIFLFFKCDGNSAYTRARTIFFNYYQKNCVNGYFVLLWKRKKNIHSYVEFTLSPTLIFQTCHCFLSHWGKLVSSPYCKLKKLEDVFCCFLLSIFQFILTIPAKKNRNIISLFY